MTACDSISAWGSSTYDCLQGGKISKERLINQVALSIFTAASYLTDPVCKSQELLRRIQIVDALYPLDASLLNLARKVMLALVLSGCALAALITTLPGVGLRILGSYVQPKAFLEFQEEGEPKDLGPGSSFSLLSWNVCCVGGGYAISDGGVMPWSFRMDRLVDKIVEADADVNCLYEMFDFHAAKEMYERLKEHGYTHFYFNIGPKAVGVNSGMLVASKYRVSNPNFTPYPIESLVGRTKGAVKGIFSFDLESRGTSFARIFATHAQHSELPAQPTEEEIESRKWQMRILDREAAEVERNRCVVLTGDFNLDEEELSMLRWERTYIRGRVSPGPSWEGDAFCARLMDKPVSRSLNLDYTLARRAALETTHIETGYDPEIFSEVALSDHKGLLSKIILTK